MQGKQACGRVWRSGAAPVRHAFAHSRRREFCCLEPGAGGGKGEGVVASHSGATAGLKTLLAGRVMGDTGDIEPLLLRRWGERSMLGPCF